MFSKNIFCERLKNERLKLNQTQSAVGSAIKVPKQYVSRWEKGNQEPNLATICALADYFNVSIDYLVGRTDRPEINK